ncbi:MAG: hypothetical protein IT285_13195 [Bdellovibrionales bacterium]|nr:hypothetical protein [Bdellovibrionales bacterium]
MERELLAAMKRGVKVRVITNSLDSSDEADYTVVGMLLKTRKLVKAAVFGGRWAYVGNSTPRARSSRTIARSWTRSWTSSRSTSSTPTP